MTLMWAIRMENVQFAALLLVAFMAWPSQGTAEANFSETPTNTSNPVLNMAHYSLDDKYKGCLSVMRSNLNSLIQSELNASEIYNEAWNKALLVWRVHHLWLYPRKIKQLASVAVYAYTLGSPPLYSTFNSATRMAGKGPEEYKAYSFKSLHFLLTWATLNFQSWDLKCVKVFRGTSVEFSVNDLFRFGQFTSTSESLKVAKRFEAVTFFKLFTCKGVEISDMSAFEGEEEVLVPPYEIFKVTSVKNTSSGRTIHAKSVGTCSYHNCAFVGKGWNNTKACPEHQVLYM